MTTPAAACWICLEEGEDERGHPLLRNCACRGQSGAGWAHMPCLAGFAKSRTDALTSADVAQILEECKGTVWSNCNVCKQKFHGDLRVDLAREWLDIVSGSGDANPQRIAALLNFAEACVGKTEYDTAIETYEDVLVSVRGLESSMKRNYMNGVDDGGDALLWGWAQTDCFGKLSEAYSLSGNEEKAREYAEKFREATIKGGMASPDAADEVFGMVFNAQDNPEGSISTLMSMYQQQSELEGKDSTTCIELARTIAEALVHSGKMKESLPWHKDAHDRAKRVYGKTHPDTIDIKQKFLLANASFGPRRGKLVMKDPKLNGREVSVLRTTKDGKKYIVAMESETSEPQKAKVSPSQLVLETDTPIEMGRNGDCFTVFVESYDAENDSYKVFATTGAGGNHSYLNVPRKETRVKFVPAEIAQLGMLFGA